MRHFLDIHATDAPDLRRMIDEAARIKSARAGQPKAALDQEAALEGQMVALIFEKPSTRTRVHASWSGGEYCGYGAGSLPFR